MRYHAEFVSGAYSLRCSCCRMPVQRWILIVTKGPGGVDAEARICDTCAVRIGMVLDNPLMRVEWT